MTRWLDVPQNFTAPGIVCFRRNIECRTAETLEFDYSADELCTIFLDGRPIADGPEPGAPEYWISKHLKLELASGFHVLTARVCCFGKGLSPHWMMTCRHGFYTSLGGPWSVKAMQGISFESPLPDWGSAPRVHTGKDYDPTILSGLGSGWENAVCRNDARELHLSELPPQQLAAESRFHREGDRIVFDDYVCVWACYRFSGTGRVRIRWAETGYLSSISFNNCTQRGEKGRRDGTYLVGNFDVFDISGSFEWFDLQWRAGRILQIICDDGVRLEECSFISTGYPYPDFIPPEGKYKQLAQIAFRTLQCCSHESFMDCPFYERLNYIGDARIEALTGYVLGIDPALARKSLKMIALSQAPDGMIASRYPAKIHQEIPSFVPIWILMLHDYATWVRDLETVRELLPCARKIAGLFRSSQGKDGLIRLRGWGFIDWQWPERGVPFGSEDGTNSILNLLVSLAMKRLADVERLAGSHENAEADDVFSDRLLDLVYRRYYDSGAGMIADDAKHCCFSEHAQVLALLLRDTPELLQGLASGKCSVRCGIYFSFYYLQACRLRGAEDLFNARLDDYLQLCGLGLKTLPEDFIMPRSDCHAWSAHVLYHLLSGKEQSRHPGN